ncbi:MAG: DUF1194 domain-containing protein [Alphaproteobacteria bacterium]|nr:DUF1194 domain-containing protein [Alphaproteobacteria bacterium]
MNATRFDRRFARLLAVAFGALVLLQPTSGRAERVDLELVLAVDGSGSIDENEFKYQRAGYAAAITDKQVLAAITSGAQRKIAMAFVEWGGEGSIHTIVDWAVIRDAASAKSFAGRLVRAPRKALGYNSISGAILHAAAMMRTNKYVGKRQVIDVSGDGPQIGLPPLPPARALAIAQGITINGLVVAFRGGVVGGGGGEPLAEHYKRDVIGGRGAFVIIADRKEHFAEAILHKMVREIAGQAPAIQSTQRISKFTIFQSSLTNR